MPWNEMNILFFFSMGFFLGVVVMMGAFLVLISNKLTKDIESRKVYIKIMKQEIRETIQDVIDSGIEMSKNEYVYKGK